MGDEKEQKKPPVSEGGTLVDEEGVILQELLEEKEREKPPPIPEVQDIPTKVVSVEEEEEPEKTVLMDISSKEEKLLPEGDKVKTPPPTGKILIVFGNDRGREFFVSQKTTLVGRSLECDIVLNDPSVSRKHFNIIQSGRAFKLIDLGSGNGTIVNGVKVQEIELRDGARIECGTSSMTFQIVDEEATKILDSISAPMDEAPTRYEQPVIPIPKKIEVKPPLQKEIPVVKVSPFKQIFPIFGGIVIFALLIVVTGHLFFGWKFIGFLSKKETLQVTEKKSPDYIALKEEKEIRKKEAEDYFRKGLGFFRDKEWEMALVQFNKAKEIYPSLEGIKDSIEKAKIEKEARENIENGLHLIKKNDFSKAKEIFNKIPEHSVYFMEAQNYLKEIISKEIEEKINNLKGVLSKGKKEEVKKELLSLLSEYPDSEIVLAFKEDVEKKGLNLYEKEMPKKPVSIKEKPPKKIGWKVEGDPFKLYNSGNFATAIEKFKEMGEKSKHQKDRAHYLNKADTVSEFAAKYQRGKINAQKYLPFQAIPDLLRAMELDRKITGHYQKELKNYLGEMYSFISAEKYGAKNYVESANYIRKALSINPDDSYAKNIEQKLYQKASSMLEEAKNFIQKGKKEKAKELLIQVIRIAPPHGEIYQESYQLYNKIKIEK